MKLKLKIVIVVAAAAAIAAASASWKWRGHAVQHANVPYKVAGWSWGSGKQSPGHPS